MSAPITGNWTFASHGGDNLIVHFTPDSEETADPEFVELARRKGRPMLFGVPSLEALHEHMRAAGIRWGAA